MPPERTARVELRLEAASPGPQELGKRAQEIRALLHDPSVDPRDTRRNLMQQGDQFDGGAQNRMGPRVTADFGAQQRRLEDQETIWFNAVRNGRDVQYRTVQQIAILRQTMNRLQAFSDINSEQPRREEQMRLLFPALQDLDRRTTLIQYNDALLDDFLTTVTDYANFWSRNEVMAKYLQDRNPPTLWQQLQQQERMVAAMLKDFKETIPQTAKVAEARLLRYALWEDGIATELGRVPENRRGETIAQLLRDFPGLNAIPSVQRSMTVLALMGDAGYRTLTQQVGQFSARELTRTERDIRVVFQNRLNSVEKSLREGAIRVSALLTEKQPWEDNAYNLLLKLQLPQGAVDGRRAESFTLQELRDRYRDNVVLRDLYEALPVNLRDVRFDTIRADVEARYILRAGLPTADANAVTILLMPDRTRVPGEAADVNTADCTLEQLTRAYPNHQILEQFCRLVTPDTLSKRVRDLNAHELLQLQTARLAAYNDNIEKRTRDMFRIGQPWQNVQGQQSTYEVRIAHNMYAEVLLARADKLGDEIFTSGNAGALPELMRGYREAINAEMAYHEQALSMNAQLMSLVAIQRHFGPMRRLSNFNQLRLNPREVQALQENLPPAIRDELNEEWERYGVGLNEYLQALEAVCDKYGDFVNHAHERMVRTADHIAKKLGEGWLLADQIGWWVPDNLLRIPWTDLSVGNGVRAFLRARGATWVIDRQAIRDTIAGWRNDFESLRDVLTNFKDSSAVARNNVRKDVALLQRLTAVAPPQDLAAIPFAPQIPNFDRWIQEPPEWLPQNLRTAYSDAKNVRQRVDQNAPNAEALNRSADDRIRKAEQDILEAYITHLLARYTAAKGALERARKDGNDAAITQAQNTFNQVSSYICGVYSHLFEALETRDLPAMQGHVRDLMKQLADKVDYHATNFHYYDQIQYSPWSAITGGLTTWLSYNLIIRPVAGRALTFGWNQSAGRMWSRLRIQRAPTFGGAWVGRQLTNLTRYGWNNTVGWQWPGARWPVPGEVPRRGAINWGSLAPDVKANYLQQLGREVQQISQEAARVGRLPTTDPTRAKALADLEARAVALQERMAGLGTTEYRQLANNMFPGRSAPLTEVQHELMYRAHMHGGNIRPDAAWSHPTIIQKQRILMGIDPMDPTKGLRLLDGTELRPPARAGQPATFPDGHPRAGQAAGLTLEEAQQTMRAGMAGERTAAAGAHVPNPRNMMAMPVNTPIARGLMRNPNALFSMTRAEMRALVLELRTLNPNQAKALMDELKAAARTNPELARALENSRMAQRLERLGAQAAGELGSLRFVGMAVFEVAVFAFQVYLFVESVRAYNKAVEQSQKSIEEMRKQVVAAGFYHQGNDSYHHPTLDVTINLKDLERGLGADARERWWAMVTAGGGLVATTTISVLSMMSVIGGPVTIALMVGVVIVEFIINKVAEKVKESEYKEFLSKCPAWLLMSLGTIQTVHDTPDGFLKKLELGRDGVEESAARKLVFMIWLRDLQRFAPETYRELTADLGTWHEQQKFFDEQFCTRIYPEWKRCLFMRRHGRRHNGTIADDNLTAELVKDYYLSEYIPIADMIRTQQGANSQQIRQAVVDSAVGALPGIRLNRQWQMQQQLLANGDSFVEGMDPPVQLSTMLATSGSSRLPESQARTANSPGFRMGPTLSQHIETWVSSEYGTWLLKSRFGSTDGAAVDVGGGEVVQFAYTNGKWQCNRRGQNAVDVTATVSLAGLNTTQQSLLRTIALGLLRSDTQQPDDWLRREYGRYVLQKREGTTAGAAEGELNVFVRTGVPVTFAFQGGQWKWKLRAADAFQALTIAPTLDAGSLATFREIVQDILMIDVPVTQATMRVFLEHCKKSNLRPLVTISEPAMYVNNPEELYEFIEDPIVRMRTMQAGSGVRGTRDTAPWALGHRNETADQAFAVQTLIRGNWGIPRAQFGNDALGSAIRYQRAGGLYANDGEQPHMRRITTATQELLDSMQNSERKIPVVDRPALAAHIFGGVTDQYARPLVMSGERRRQGPIPTDAQVQDLYKTITDHTLGNDMLPSNGPDRIYDSIRSTFSRRNLRGVVFESAMFNEGERRNTGYNLPAGEEDVFVVNALFVFHDGQRQYYLRRGIVCRKDSAEWRPVYGAAMAETQQSLPREASRHLSFVDRYRRYDITNSVMRRFNEASLRENAPAARFAAQPQLSAQLFPGRTGRPLVYVRPPTVPLEVGTPAYDVVRRLTERQQQDAALQLQNPSAYFIEFRDTTHGAGGIQQQGRELLVDRFSAQEGEAGEFVVRTGEEPNIRSLSLKCIDGTWHFKNASNAWVSVQQDVLPADVGNDRVAAGHMNRNVFMALRALRTRQTLEAVSTAVPEGDLHPGVMISRQGAVATCQQEGPGGAWNTWTIESGARIGSVRDGTVDRSMWLRDAASIRHEDIRELNAMLQEDRRQDTERTITDATEQLVVHHRLNTADGLPSIGYADLPPVNGSQRLQMHRSGRRTVLFQERLPSYDQRAVQAYLRFDTTEGPRLWPLRGVQFASLPNEAALQPHSKLIAEQRALAAQSWGVPAERLTLSYYLSPSAQGNDSFVVDGILGGGRQYGFASAQQIMEMQNFSARREILELLSTPVYRQVNGAWNVDSALSLNRILRQFPVELADGLDCRDQLVTAVAPLLERAPDKQYFLRKFFDVLYANGTLHRTAIERIAQSPVLRDAATKLLIPEAADAERVIPLTGGLSVEIRSGFPEGSVSLRVVNKDGESVEGARVSVERILGGDAAPTTVNPGAPSEDGSTVYTLASLRGVTGGVVHLSITQTVNDTTTSLLTRVPVDLVSAMPSDTNAIVEASRQLVQRSGPRELLFTQGEGLDSRTTVLRQSPVRNGARSVSSRRFGTLLNFGSPVVIQELTRGGETDMNGTFETIGYLRSYPPVPQLLERLPRQESGRLGIVSTSIGESDGDTLQSLWDSMPAALKTYARREPLEMADAELTAAMETTDKMQALMETKREARENRRYSALEAEVYGLLNEMEDELVKMQTWRNIRTVYTTPRQVAEPGNRGFNRSEFEDPIQRMLDLYLHDPRHSAEDAPSANRRRFVTNMSALYRTLNTTQRRDMLTRMMNALDAAALQRIRSANNLSEEDLRMFAIDSSTLESIRAGEYLRVRHNATERDGVYTVTLSGKAVEFTFRDGMMHYRKSGLLTWKDITQPLTPADLDNSAEAANAFNARVFPDLLAGLDFLPREILNRIYGEAELRRMPGVTESNGIYNVTIDGKALRMRWSSFGWEYISTRVDAAFGLRSLYLRGTLTFDRLTNPPVTVVGNGPNTPLVNHVFTVRQQGARAPQPALEYKLTQTGWQFKAAGNTWKSVTQEVAAADVGNNAAAVAFFNTRVHLELQNWVGSYVSVQAVDTGGDAAVAQRFSTAFAALSRNFGNRNSGVLTRIRGMQYLQSFSNPRPTEADGVITIAQQGVENPKQLRLKFDEDQWKYQATGENVWKAVHERVIAEDVGGSAAAAEYFNTSVLPRMTHSMLRRTALVAEYEQLVGANPDETVLARVRSRSQSPFYQQVRLSRSPVEQEDDDATQEAPQADDVIADAPQHRDRYMVRYLSDSGQYIVLPEPSVQPSATNPLTPGIRGPLRPLRFGVRTEGDTQTEWISLTSLTQLSDPSIPNLRRTLIRRVLTTPQPQFSLEQLPAEQLRDARALKAALVASQSTELSLAALNRYLATLPTDNRRAREQVAANVSAVLAERPACAKKARLNVAGTAIEIVDQLSVEAMTLAPADMRLATDLRDCAGNTAQEAKALEAINKRLADITEGGAAAKASFVAGVERVLESTLPIYPRAIRLNQAGTAAELAPRSSNAIDSRPHRLSLSTILDLCTADTADNEEGVLTDYREALLQFLEPLYLRAVRKDLFLERVIAELETKQFVINRDTLTDLRRNFQSMQLRDTFAPRIVPTQTQDIELGGCTLRVSPNGPDAIRFQVITPPGAPHNAFVTFDEERFDRRWAVFSARDGVLARQDWSKLLTATVYVDGVAVADHMPIRIDNAQIAAQQERTREELLRNRLTADVTALRTEATKATPNMLVLQRMVGDINSYLPQVKDADGAITTSARLLAALGATAFPAGRMAIAGQRGLILAEVAGEGSGAVPQLRFASAAVLHTQLTRHWQSLVGASESLTDVRARIREFNARLEDVRRMELPFLTQDHRTTALAAHPGYRLMSDTIRQQVTLAYAPQEALPVMQNSLALPQQVLAVGSITTITRTEPGPPPEDVSVTVTVEQEEGRAPTLRYVFSNNVEGANDAAKLRDVGVSVQQDASQPGQSANTLRVSFTLNTAADRLGAYAVTLPGAGVRRYLAREDLEWMRDIDSGDKRGQWIRPRNGAYAYLCQIADGNARAYYRASGEARERLTADGLRWEPVPETERAALPAVPGR